MGVGKKILIGLGILFIVIIAIVVMVGAAFLASIGSDVREKEKLLEGLTEEQKFAFGNMIDNCKNNMGYLQSEEIGKRVEEECMKGVKESINKLKAGG